MEDFKGFLKDLLKIRWMLVYYDVLTFIVCALAVLIVTHGGVTGVVYVETFCQIGLALACVLVCRLFGKIYRQIWRYGGIQCYIRLLTADFGALLLYGVISSFGAVEHSCLTETMTLICLNSVCSLTLRMIYRYAYKCGNQETPKGRFLLWLLRVFGGIEKGDDYGSQKIKIAIVGAGQVGVSLAEELLNNENSAYVPRCFVDVNKGKYGREVHGISVLSEEEATFGKLNEYEIQEVVFALPSLDNELKKSLYEYYRNLGYKVKVYDYPTMESAGKRRYLREFDVEELLFRKPIVVADERTNEYYMDKVVLITGGGGSIGSELCRQLAKFSPKQIIILDIYENGVYNVQQELRLTYGQSLDLQIEIVSITNRAGLARVFERYHPQIVINAAAHKHVPLMEHNCVEAVENNVFGTQNVIELCEEYGAERFMMVSTDKAVNPTNVMGATKRMCEMLVQSQSTRGKVKYSCTRFGNVLGSAGSVIPLFKRQIANGGPVTLTDKRIIRYFMTIPEASQLVLQSGAMAKNGELFVLDMGEPVKILDLARNMIRLSGVKGIEIVETGLRPGEKLYEELLVKTEELDQTENSLIFIERDEALSEAEIAKKIALLREACASGDDDAVKAALKQAVPTFKDPEEVNNNLPDRIDVEIEGGTDEAKNVVIETTNTVRRKTDSKKKRSTDDSKGDASKAEGKKKSSAKKNKKKPGDSGPAFAAAN